MAINEEETPPLTNESDAEKRKNHKKWNRCNCLSMKLLRVNISKGIKGSIPECQTVLELLAMIDEQFIETDKSKASTLIKRFSSLKYDGKRGVREHIMNMRDIAAQLRARDVGISNTYLVHHILNSLPKKYGPFKGFLETRLSKENEKSIYSENRI
ncbi:uncharacterized protein LOC122084907 [Macadamia integrifolia]|uniref:uncharacterized protein LOC122084907 n=1 Tax=Macadamia integrifolia TaxID=60698 RepID=UPI001C4EE6A1|nr:uncharacterized protein LOC122084907 [Macadamia integrifolia]